MPEMLLQNVQVPLQPFWCVKQPIFVGLITRLSRLRGLESVSKLETSDSELEVMEFV